MDNPKLYPKKSKRGKVSLPVLSNAGQIPVKLAKELVEVEDFGFAVWVHELTAGELDEYRQPMYEVDENNKFKINIKGQALRMCVYAMRDADGNRLYPNVNQGIEDLGERGSAGVEQIAKVANRLSKQSGDDDKTLAKNSVGGQTAVSLSD